MLKSDAFAIAIAAVVDTNQNNENLNVTELADLMGALCDARSTALYSEKCEAEASEKEQEKKLREKREQEERDKLQEARAVLIAHGESVKNEY